MNRFASVTFGSQLAPGERASVAHDLASFGATPTSWAVTQTRSFARIACVRALPDAGAIGALRVDEPSLVALRVRAHGGLDALAETFDGAAWGAGIVDVVREKGALVVAAVAAHAPPAVLLGAIDAELGGGAERSIDVLLPFDDATLAAFAGVLLGEPDLDASRLIETYLEPLLAGTAP